MTKTMTIAIVDYGMGNLFSIYNALDYVGGSPKIINEPAELTGAEGIVVPGVGAFGQCMDRLCRFESALNSARESEIPIFAICIGLQVLFEESEESPAARGRVDKAEW
jgi:glutamine amidotransferase